jgi:hypothetical protein
MEIDHSKVYNAAKVGRSTGWTSRTTNAISTVLNQRVDNSSIASFRENTKGRGTANRVTLCHGIISHRERPFAEEGDRGSVVLLNRPANEQHPNAIILGVLFGVSRVSRLPYMAPFGLILRDIENIASRRILSPCKVEGRVR